MKDAGIFAGSCTTGYLAWDQMGSLSFYHGLQVIMMFLFILLISVFGGIAGAFSQHLFLKFWNQWSGKGNGMKRYL